MILVSAIINFPLLDGEKLDYEKLGGYISWPLLAGLNALFGEKAIAIKVFIILLFLLVVAWILYSFNFSLPKLNISLKEEKRPERPERSSRDDEDSRRSSSFERTAEEKSSSRGEGVTQTISPGFIKSLLKHKLEEKIQEKEKEKKAFKPLVNFS
jgi:hypothetical protein